MTRIGRAPFAATVLVNSDKSCKPKGSDMRANLLATAGLAIVFGTGVAMAQAPKGDEGAKPAGAPSAPTMSHGSAQGQSGAAGKMTPGNPSPEQHTQNGAPGASESHRAATPAADGKGEAASDEHSRSGERSRNAADSGRESGSSKSGTTPGAANSDHAAQRGNDDEAGRKGQDADRSGGNGGRAASVQLSSQQRSRLRSELPHNASARVGSDVHIDVAVGAAVPRTVHVVALPADIVEIVPEYRGYDYIIVGDEIVIVDPETLEIAAVIPA